ncbi:uncharacterized protein BDZ99DRAFT_342198, partial [Mytilinidion resinicola]
FDQDDIVGELKVFPFDSAPKYEALSYVWGPPEPTKSITLNGQEVSVGVSLFAALHGLRLLNQSTNGKSNTERVLWIDAVCVDQKNNEEKSHQVKMMGSVYKKAETVLVLLG